MTCYLARLHDLLQVADAEGWELAETDEEAAEKKTFLVPQGEEYLWRLLARLRKVRTLRLREMSDYVLFGAHSKYNLNVSVFDVECKLLLVLRKFPEVREYATCIALLTQSTRGTQQAVQEAHAGARRGHLRGAVSGPIWRRRGGTRARRQARARLARRDHPVPGLRAAARPVRHVESARVRPRRARDAARRTPAEHRPLDL